MAELRYADIVRDIRSGMMENKNELITEVVNAFREFARNEYIAGMKGEPQTELPLPENTLPEDNIIHHFVCALRRDADLAYKAGKNGEPLELPFSDKYIASMGLIEKSLQ